jgi:hypothetical protein
MGDLLDKLSADNIASIYAGARPAARSRTGGRRCSPRRGTTLRRRSTPVSRIGSTVRRRGEERVRPVDVQAQGPRRRRTRRPDSRHTRGQAEPRLDDHAPAGPVSSRAAPARCVCARSRPPNHHPTTTPTPPQPVRVSRRVRVRGFHPRRGRRETVMPTTQELREQRANVFSQMKEINDRADHREAGPHRRGADRVGPGRQGPRPARRRHRAAGEVRGAARRRTPRRPQGSRPADAKPKDDDDAARLRQGVQQVPEERDDAAHQRRAGRPRRRVQRGSRTPSRSAPPPPAATSCRRGGVTSSSCR